MQVATRWEIARAQPETVVPLGKALEVSPIFAQILLNRGYHDADAARFFLRCQLRDLTDPFRIGGISAAVERTMQALQGGQNITLYGDYDVDGVTSVTILKRVLEALAKADPLAKRKAVVQAYLPDRFDVGYGLNQAGIERCLAIGKPDLLIVLDCGTNSREEVRHLQATGVDVVILDHHEALDSSAPLALVNPKAAARQNSSDGGPEENETPYCTAGLTFKFCHALLKTARRHGSQGDGSHPVDLKDLLDLVALATVADVVPLIGENRIFVRHGLKQMKTTRWSGLKALMKVAAIRSTPTVSDCGFRLGPRLNAAGRLESAMTALHLLMSEDDARAEELALQLDETNRQRQQEEIRVFKEAREEALVQAQDERTRVLVLARPGWHEGVIGIVASRLVQEFHLPTFVVSLNREGMGRGSGRSVDGFNLVAAVEATAVFLERGGGHAMAAGVTVKTDQVEPWRTALQECACRLMGGVRTHHVIRLDAEVRLPDLNPGLCQELEKLEPCGMGNPRPLLIARKVEVASEPRRVGGEGRHLKLWLRQEGTSVDAIGFGMGERPVVRGQLLDVAFELENNEHRGQKRLQLNLREVMQAGSC